MQFSGERYMPSIDGETRYEHIHRYAWIAPVVAGKTVLDIASGSGYGSAILAGHAASVTGVDVSEEAVEYANKTYGNGKSLRYLHGDATRIPLADASVDVVVSFETIEHLLPQVEMIAELRRVLKPKGFLIISSPNRDIYSDQLKQANPFHLKELNFTEFDEMLKVKFPQVRYFGQRVARASFVYPTGADGQPQPVAGALESLIDAADGVERRPPALIDPVYFVAFAAANARYLPELPASVLLDDTDAVSREMLDFSDAVVERDGRLAALYAANEEAEARYKTLQADVAKLSDDVVERDGRLYDLYHAMERHEAARAQFEQQLAEAQTGTPQAVELEHALAEVRLGLELAKAEAERGRARSIELMREMAGERDEVFERDLELAALKESSGRMRERAVALAGTVASLHDTLADRDTRVAELQQESLGNAQRAMALAAQVEALNVSTRDLDHRNHVLSVSLAEAVAKAAELEQSASSLAERLADDENAIASLKGVSATHETMRGELQGRCQELEDSRRLAEAACRETATLRAQLEARSAELARMEAAMREVDSTLKRVLSSRSWAFGRPVRLAGRVARSVKRRLSLLLGGASTRAVATAIAHESAALPPIDEDAERFASEKKLLADSALFDADWYLSSYQDVAVARLEPVEHYLTNGAREGRRPSAHFDGAWYFEQYPDVAESRGNPLVHFLLYGEREGRSPSPDFDTVWYHQHYPDVREAGLNGVIHYVLHGAKEGRHPNARAEASLEELRALLPPSMERFFERQEPYEAWMSVNAFTSTQAADLRAALAERAGRTPRISLITPVYNTPEPLLRELVQSVLAQVHDDWELCLVDDASPSAHVKPLLAEIAAMDPRIKIKSLKKNGGISVATNAAVTIATGQVIAFLDHDDLITPDCLGEIAIYYADHPEADVVYSDDDKIDLEGRRFAPQFKPDWSPTLLLSYMYMSHVLTVRRSLFTALGGFRTPFDGSQDYDFALRATEQARHVGHVPKVLYHWRVVPGSTAASGDAKPESFENGRRAVEEALQRRGVAGVVTHPEWARQTKVGMFAVEFPDHGPEVTIVIPTYNQVGYLRTCVESLPRTTYRNFDVLVIDNDSDDPATLAYLAEVAKRPGHRVVKIPKTGGKFSFAALMNQAVGHVTAEYALLLNNDTEVVNPRWLSQMVGCGQLEGVGAVGARLYFEDGTLQHAGIVHGYHEGLVGHAFRNAPPHDWGYMGFVRTAREYSAVTAACMLTPRALFESLGGFDEKNFAVAYNDVDYGYRVIQSGRRCVYCADAELFHYEGKSRPKKDDPKEVVALRRIYGDWRDAWYNPNLSLENESFEPAMERQVGRDQAPPHVVVVSHNLAFEGAPNTLCDLVIGLVQAGQITATVLSPLEGPLRAAYEAAGVSVQLFTPPSIGGAAEPFLESCRVLGALFRELGAQVVVANTLPMFFATTAAHGAGLPTIWCQHESEPWQTYFNYVAPEIRGYAYAAFAQAYRVTYVADATRRGWRALETRGNFRVIRHGIPKARLAEERARWTRQQAREAIGATPDDVVISLVGTVCSRKGQADLVEAFNLLSADLKARVKLFIAGAHVEKDYADDLRDAIASLAPELAERIVLTGPVPDSIVYYAAADIYVCTSRIESAPRVIVEAMAFGLPIITTPVFGIPELVDENINAVFYPPGEADRLAELLTQLIQDEPLRQRLASHSVDGLESRPGFEEMVAAYAKAIRQAAMLNDGVPAKDGDGFAGDPASRPGRSPLISSGEMAYP